MNDCDNGVEVLSDGPYSSPATTYPDQASINVTCQCSLAISDWYRNGIEGDRSFLATMHGWVPHGNTLLLSQCHLSPYVCRLHEGGISSFFHNMVYRWKEYRYVYSRLSLWSTQRYHWGLVTTCRNRFWSRSKMCPSSFFLRRSPPGIQLGIQTNGIVPIKD